MYVPTYYIIIWVMAYKELAHFLFQIENPMEHYLKKEGSYHILYFIDQFLVYISSGSLV